jgi:DNA-directed RNA polymerase subunit beta
VPTTSGLEEIFEEISPIEDFSGSMSLSFRDHRFEPPKYSIDECKERDMTYSAPLFVTAEFMNTTTGEIKSQTGLHGRLPAHDRARHVRDQRHRARRRLAAGPLAGRLLRAHRRQDSDKDVYTAKIIPSAARGSSSRSTSATWSASASTASASSR